MIKCGLTSNLLKGKQGYRLLVNGRLVISGRIFREAIFKRTVLSAISCLVFLFLFVFLKTFLHHFKQNILRAVTSLHKSAIFKTQ